MKTELRLTEDGSHTLFVPSLNEHYHSVHGAVQESTHVFIRAGLDYCRKNPISVLEVGFGTGLTVSEFKTALQNRINQIKNFTVANGIIDNYLCNRKEPKNKLPQP